MANGEPYLYFLQTKHTRILLIAAFLTVVNPVMPRFPMPVMVGIMMVVPVILALNGMRVRRGYTQY